MFRLLVDFNEIDDDRVHGLQAYAEGPRALRPGDRLLAHDGGQEEALGVVESVDGELVRVEVDWSTFGVAGRFRYLVGGAWLAVVGTASVFVGEPGQPPPRVLSASSSLINLESDANSVKLPA